MKSVCHWHVASAWDQNTGETPVAPGDEEGTGIQGDETLVRAGRAKQSIQLMTKVGNK